MASLSIRNLPDEVHTALRVRAAKSGCSMEAEARAILSQTCLPEKVERRDFSKLQTLVSELYHHKKPPHVVDDLIKERRAEAKSE
jgi:plasmid stability protein